jgi:hypothetical protein
MITARSMSKVKPEVTPVSATPAMTKEQEARFRERATTVNDRVAEMMRAMFSTIDVQRAVAAEHARMMGVVDDVLDELVPQCAWAECEERATCQEVDNSGEFFCDRHTNGSPMKDCRWAPLLRARRVAQADAAKESPTGKPVAAKE